MNDAVKKLREGDYTLVIEAEKLYTSKERGVKPLLNLIDKGADVRGGICADRVVGNAAAMLYTILGVKAVYADVMSSPAKQTLLSHGIEAECAVETPRIKNRAGDGFCPMETAVAGISDPYEALAAVRAKLRAMAASS